MFANNPNNSLQLLKYLDLGMQNAAVDLVKRCPEALETHHKYTDTSGHTFYFITPFEYLLWSLDVKYMGPAILDALQQVCTDTTLFQRLLIQWEKLETHGLWSKFNDEFVNETCFDFNPIIKAIRNYIAAFNAKKSQDEILRCLQALGQQQMALPQHLRQEFCNSYGCMYSSANGKLVNQNSRSTYIYNSINNGFLEWNNQLPGLGSDFVLVRGYGRFPVTRTGEYRVPREEERDLYVFRLLQHLRGRVDLNQMKSRLLSMSVAGVNELSLNG